MSVISIQKMGITDFGTDAIVNAANTQLAPGAGVCGAIFKAAGYDELDAACKKIGGCKTGKAVITQGFNLLAKHVIHTVGPIWNGGSNNEPQLLYSAYKQSLFVARDNKLHSITFPLISARIYGYPIDKAWRKALQACADFIMEHENEHYAIIFAVLDQKIMDAGVKEMRNLLSDNKYKDFEGFSNARDIRPWFTNALDKVMELTMQRQ